jgi:2'-5' RNA ligase
MQGIVTLLDPAHYAATEALWTELAEALGLRGVYVTPFPHFSYHVAHGYARDALAAALSQAAATPPFTVTTAGLAVFTGPAPVLYIPVVRTAALSAFHAALWEALEPAAAASQAYYAPDSWVPHITLGFGDLTRATLTEAVRLLGGRSFTWEIPVDHLAYIDDAGGTQSVAQRVSLGA